MTSRGPVVLKFGGESLAEPDLVVDRIRRLRDEHIPVVAIVSARAGVTDLLRSVLDPEGRPPTGADVVDRLRLEHPGLPASADAILARIRRLVNQVGRARSARATVRDELLSQGERLASHWFAAYLVTRGIAARPVESDRGGLTTDNSYGAARVLMDRSEAPVRRAIRPILRAGVVPVVTGFFGRSREGRVATLGRGGSDYSASAFGALLGARRVELVKRNVAISTADPRLVPAARPVPQLSYEEAEEIAQFGAKVLHPAAIEPAASRGVPVLVRSLNHHELTTTIGTARRGAAARAVTLLGPLRLHNVRIAGGRQRPGLIAEIAQRLTERHVNLAAVVTTEAVLGLLVEPHDSARAGAALHPLAEEYGAVLGHPLPVSLVSAVGERIIEELPKISPAILRQAGGVLVTARSISIVVPQDHAVRVLRTLHRIFVERPAGVRRRRPRRPAAS